MGHTGGVPAGSNPDHRSAVAVPVFQDARNHFEGAVEFPGHEMGSATASVAEPSFDERVEANRQFEQARHAKLRELGFDATETKPFEYADARDIVEEVSDETSEVELDFDEESVVVDENGDIVEDDEFSVDPELLASAVPVPVPEDHPKPRGRPRTRS